MNRILLVLALMTVFGCGSQQTEEAKTVVPGQEQFSTPTEDPFIEEGITFLHNGNAAQAIKSFDESIKHDPTDPEKYMILGHTYMRLQNYHRAVDTFNAAIRYSENKGEVYYLLAVCYGLIGDQEMTQESIQKSIEIFTAEHDEKNLAKALGFIQSLNGAAQAAETAKDGTGSQ